MADVPGVTPTPPPAGGGPPIWALYAVTGVGGVCVAGLSLAGAWEDRALAPWLLLASAWTGVSAAALWGAVRPNPWRFEEEEEADTPPPAEGEGGADQGSPGASR